MEFVTENKAKFEALRAKYPDFSYLDYSWAREGAKLAMSFTYALSAADIVTTTLEMTLPEEVSDETVRAHEDFIFRIGLIEALSYWKAYCSPKIKILCGTLSEAEVLWWTDTWFDGMGEFRYRNGLLDIEKDSWVTFSFDRQKHFAEKAVHDFSGLSGNLIAFTGGKDSTLALGLLKDIEGNTNETFFVSASAPMREKIKDVLGVTQYPETLVERHMHERLLSLNKEGALNGHTPFSIVVALLGTFAASLRGKKYFVVANESSAEEPTVPGTDINHQYSKSLHFEKRFQKYATEVWPDGPQYYSLLRPLSEIAISLLLKKFEDAMPLISSCNAKEKSGCWCGTCAKCLFAFLLFAAAWDVPFAEKMFGVNMFMNADLLSLLEELTGNAETRPFECVGTTQESLALVAEIVSKSDDAARMPLISAFLAKYPDGGLPENVYKIVACEFHEHAIPDMAALELLKRAHGEVCYG